MVYSKKKSKINNVHRKEDLLKLFSKITNKTILREPITRVHGTLRDKGAVEREIALVIREITEREYFKTSLSPVKLARLILLYHDGKNDSEIATARGDKKLSKTVSRARIRLKLFREHDFSFPFDLVKMKELCNSDLTMKEVAEELGISPTSLREHKHVLESKEDKSLDPYLERIIVIIEDKDLTEHMAYGLNHRDLVDAIDRTEAEIAEID